MSGIDFCKCVVVGDGAVGKTSLLSVFAQNIFPDEYSPTIFDNYQSNIEIDGKAIQLALMDTAGQDTYDRIRPVSYAGAHVFIVAYSTVYPASFNNIKSKWVPEIRHHAGKNARIVLVGTKIDLKDDQKTIETLKSANVLPINDQKAEQLLRELHLDARVVCSSKKQIGVKEVFETAIRIGLSPKKKSGCGTQ